MADAQAPAPRASAAGPAPRLLFLFPHPIADEARNVASGASPTERLYGAEELRRRGWQVAFSDSRFSGVTGRILKFLRQFSVIGIGFGTLRDIARSDVVIVKDDFSAAAALATRVFGRKLIFLDSMFAPPQRWWKSWGTRVSLRLAHETICYSQFQKQVWIERYGNLAQRIRVLPYTIDVAFYQRFVTQDQPAPNRRILAVGRDVGRDYATLVEAIRGTDVRLDLITLPYLLRGVDVAGNPNITVHQRIAYEALFELYRDCALVVIPLKPGITYPSGIRALFEAMVMRRPFVATRNEVLQEYMTEGEHGAMAAPRDVAALREAILLGLDRGAANEPAVAASARLVQQRYDAAIFADELEPVLCELTGRGPAASK